MQKQHLKNKITSESLDKIIVEKGNYEKLFGSKKSSFSLCDVDKIKLKNLQDSLKRAQENPTEPFTFLNKIPVEDTIEGNSFVKAKNESTEIDIQLTNLMKRIELNRILLERTNQRVKDIDNLVKRSELILPKNQIYDENIFKKMKSAETTESSKIASQVEYPEIEEFHRTMNTMKDVLNYMKKISKGEVVLDDLPKELLTRVKSSNLKEVNQK
ncbi:PREDICTED: uncharacterized protein LOC107068872 [Polistes dominula]|uniref:Uncharacterized protein LOC107068872 n=1 Tax=Polistes dominula TaxID=743375 RepID=A0ABM1ILU2_POLDO|nr:PREDICTED: uncharacterized protein LOC107068872 [Polistes dominula]